MALRAYTQDEILNSGIGDNVYLQPDVDKELETVRNAAHNIAEFNKKLTEDNLKLTDEIEKLMDEIENLKHPELTENELDLIPNKHEIQNMLEEDGKIIFKDDKVQVHCLIEEIFQAGCEYILEKLHRKHDELIQQTYCED